MAENTTNTTATASQPQNNTSNWILAGASALSAISAGYNFYKSGDLSELPGVPGAQKAGAARQDALAQRLMAPQGLSDLAFNRMERGITEQSSGLIADITNQARNSLQQSPLMFDSLVKQAVQKAASIKESGMEKLGVFDIETVMANAQAAIQASQNATQAQTVITEQEREIEKERREIDAQRNQNFVNAMTNLSKALGVALGGMDWGGADASTPATGESNAETPTIALSDAEKELKQIEDAKSLANTLIRKDLKQIEDAESLANTLIRKDRDLEEMKAFSEKKSMEGEIYKDAALKQDARKTQDTIDFDIRKSNYSQRTLELIESGQSEASAVALSNNPKDVAIYEKDKYKIANSKTLAKEWDRLFSEGIK